MASEVGYPAPPTNSGLTCAALKNGTLVIDGGSARFEITCDALRVTWQTVWTDPQRRTIPRVDVRAVRSAPDTRSAERRETTQLVIDVAGASMISPLRRRPREEIDWVVARVREALGDVRPDWANERPTARTPRTATAPAKPQAAKPVTPIGPSPRVPPPPVRNGSVRRRGDAFVIRLRAASVWRTHCEAHPILLVFAFAALFGLAAFVVAAGAPSPVRYLYLMFGGIGAVLACYGILAARHIAGVAGTSYVLRLSPSALSIASIGSRKRDRLIVPRREIAAAAVGQTDEQTPAAELHLYMIDGGRMPLLTGRPVNELNWIAAQLAIALPQVPAKPLAMGEEPFRAGAILPYEPQRQRTREIDVRTAADGGVTILIPPAASDRARRVTWLIPLGAFTQVLLWVVWGPPGRLLGEARPAVAFVILIVVAWIVAKGVLYVLRGDTPTVIGVDRGFLYADFPGRFRRRKRWPRRLVRDVQLVNVEGDGRGQRPGHWVQIVFHDNTSPVEFCAHHTPADRQRLAAVLRAALELPGNA